MPPHSSTLAWKIPWMEEPGRLQSMGSTKSWTWLKDFTFTFTFHFRALEKEMPTHSSVLAWKIPWMGGAWGAAVYGVAHSRTRLKWLSSNSAIYCVTWGLVLLWKYWVTHILTYKKAISYGLAEFKKIPASYSYWKNDKTCACTL